MSTDPQRQVGMGVAPGSQPYTQLGGSLRSSSHSREINPISTEQIFEGWLSDIVLPTSKRIEGKVGAIVKIFFDNRTMQKAWGNTWFRLAQDTRELLQQYGTEDTMRGGRLRVSLTASGTSPRHGKVTIIGSGSQDTHNERILETPVFAWADMIHGITTVPTPR